MTRCARTSARKEEEKKRGRQTRRRTGLRSDGQGSQASRRPARLPATEHRPDGGRRECTPCSRPQPYTHTHTHTRHAKATRACRLTADTPALTHGCGVWEDVLRACRATNGGHRQRHTEQVEEARVQRRRPCLTTTTSITVKGCRFLFSRPLLSSLLLRHTARRR